MHDVIRAMVGFVFLLSVVQAAPPDRPMQLNPNGTIALRGSVFLNTGADVCSDATVIPIAIGPLGAPAVTTITGDDTTLTGPDCDATVVDLWWEAFELTEAADVRIGFCGTDPPRIAISSRLLSACPSSPSMCAFEDFILSSDSGIGAPECADNNRWIKFAKLPAGTYHWLVINSGAPGSYTVEITATQVAGACCDSINANCQDVREIDCVGAGKTFSPDATCCDTECMAVGAEYASQGVELLSRVTLSQLGMIPGGGWEIGGYTSPSGREYAIMGGSGSVTAYVEVTDPFNPVVVTTLALAGSVGFDLKLIGDYVFVPGGGLHVVDLSQIDDGIVTEVAVNNSMGFTDAHNIEPNPDSNHLYLSSSNFPEDLVAVDVSDVANPFISGTWSGAPLHDAFAMTYQSGPYAGREIVFAFTGGDPLFIIDVTDKTNMFTVSSVPEIPVSLGHQGWITEDLRYIILAGEGFHDFPKATHFVINVENLEAPVYEGFYQSDGCSTEHNLMIRGNLAYHGNYSSGLEIYDISNLPSGNLVAFFDTYPEGDQGGFNGAWGPFTGLPSGVILLSDRDRGLFVLNYDCNDNGIDDTIDIANQTSPDCNSNGLPDECEYDPNGTGVLADCAFAPQTPLQPESGGLDKNRYISFVVPPLDVVQQDTALRVKLTSLYHPVSPPDPPDLTASEGEYRYIAPLAFDDQTGAPIFDCVDSPSSETAFKCAGLSCTPAYLDWSGLLADETLHITGASIVPDSVYDVSMLSSACINQESTCVLATTPLSVVTTRWGNANGDAFLNVTDVVSTVDALRDAPGAIPVYSATMKPNDPDPMQSPRMTITDVVLVIDALKLAAYPFAGPSMCP
jgi:choice-of-anchor B domain-containing protein